jgi:hypothetical protein
MNSTRDESAHREQRYQELLEVQRATLQAVERLGQMFDEFADVYLNARFRYGKPTDRWSR